MESIAIRMDKLQQQLSVFSDQEIAFLVKYRLVNLNTDVQQKIKAYIYSVRGLNDLQLESLASSRIKKTGSGVRCSRCGSVRLELETYKKSCLVCEKTATRNRFLHILNFVLAFLGG